MLVIRESSTVLCIFLSLLFISLGPEQSSAPSKVKTKFTSTGTMLFPDIFTTNRVNSSTALEYQRKVEKDKQINSDIAAGDDHFWYG